MILACTLLASIAAPALAEDKVTFNYVIREGVLSYDPVAVSGFGLLKVVRNAYESLAIERHGSAEIEPLLAEAWDVRDNTEWTFKLRPGVTFSDGTPFNADAVVYNFDRYRALGGEAGTLLSEVKSVTAPDASTVVITLNQPDSAFLAALARIVYVSPTAAKANEKDGDWGAAFFAANTVGTGPYILRDLKAGVGFRLVRNDNYWRKWEPGQIEVVDVKEITDPNTQIQLLQKGDVDKVDLDISDYRDQLARNDNLQIIEGPGSRIDILEFNNAHGPFTNKLFRQAVTYAYDYEAGAQAAYNGAARVPRGPLVEGFPGFDANQKPYETDLDKAKKLLEESGVKERKLSLAYVIGLPEEKTQSAIFQASLKKLGIEVELESVPWPVFVAKYKDAEGAPDLGFYWYGAITSDPIQYIADNFDTKSIGAGNFSRFSNPEVDDLIKQARTATTTEKRDEILAKLQGTIREEYPVLFLSSPSKVEVISKRFSGYQLHPVDTGYTIWFYDLKLAEQG